MNGLTITADAECTGLASLFVATFQGIAALEAAEARLAPIRDAYWLTVDAANTLTATPEAIAAYEAADVLFEAAKAEVQALRARVASL